MLPAHTHNTQIVTPDCHCHRARPPAFTDSHRGSLAPARMNRANTVRDFVFGRGLPAEGASTPRYFPPGCSSASAPPRSPTGTPLVPTWETPCTC